uniref:B box-type domain-containing protein n=1 Tax=Aegilops tauschii subsp. strangulata TaxID=200361 RepID=A0A453SH15_AEGTS
MRVQCDVCGLEPAAVLCCADEAALCSPCNRRVHRANKLAGKHRRLTLLQPSPAANDAAAPLCDVCKERRGLVFCVEDRAILCADCDEPIHSANDLTAKHSRFLLVGAKLSADPVDQEIPSPDGSSVEQDDCSASAAEEAPAVHDASHAGGGGGGGGGSSISDYLTNICPGFEVDELLFDDAAFVAAQTFALGRSRRGATSRCRSWTPTSSTWSPPSARGSAAHGRPTCRIRRRRPGAWRSFRPLWWPRRRRRRPSRGTCGS